MKSVECSDGKDCCSVCKSGSMLAASDNPSKGSILKASSPLIVIGENKDEVPESATGLASSCCSLGLLCVGVKGGVNFLFEGRPMRCLTE